MRADLPCGRILVVEDDAAISSAIGMSLAGAGHTVELAARAIEALAMVRSNPPDLMVLDIMLPDYSGLDLLSALRRDGHAFPVIILSARDSNTDKVFGLDLGADDYVTKPFSSDELLARIRVCLRRSAVSARQWRFGDVRVDAAAGEVVRGEERVEVTATELAVLETLAMHAGRALSRSRILEIIWGAGHHGSPRTIDNFIASLRTKLEADPSRPRHLVTVRGVGYRLDLD